MPEFLRNLFFKNDLTSIVTVLLIICCVVLAMILLGKGKFKNFTFATRKIQSTTTERWIVKTTVCGIGICMLALFILKVPYFQPSPKNIGIDDWVGTWSVNLEEFNDLGFNIKSDYELEFKITEEGKIKGELFNEKGRRQATLIYISAENCSYGFLKGKMGNEDGRKQEFEFMMFPNEKTFIGKYRKRNVPNKWKTWISHLK